jgi:ABC-type phosphate transport system substrate-binding protein
MQNLRGTVLTAVAAALMSIVPAAARAQGFKVIVNASVSDRAISRTKLTRIFLKQDTSFPAGQPAAPVDLTASSPIREAFSKAVLGRGAGPVKTYWQQQVFAGRASPPPQKPSDADIVAFVSSTPGAVGYVSADAAIGDGVKLLKVDP